MKHKCLLFPLAFLALLTVSCGKPNNQQPGEEDFDLHPTWTDDSTNNFWDKHQSGSSRSDTAWNCETAIII